MKQGPGLTKFCQVSLALPPFPQRASSFPAVLTNPYGSAPTTSQAFKTQETEEDEVQKCDP